MKKITFILIVLFCFSFAKAQESNEKPYEYGDISDLKGLKKIYVNAGTDLQNRDRIMKEINKGKLGLEWVKNEDDADIYILFAGNQKDQRIQNIYGSRITTVHAGEFLVFVRVSNKPRLVISYINAQQDDWEQKPTTKFAKQFIKAYREANK